MHGRLADRSLALPVAADGAPGTGSGAGERVPEAWLVAIKDSGPLSDFDRLTLHQAVTIVVLELLRGRVAGDTERRLAGDVLAALVVGELAGPELGRRLEPFGLAQMVAAIVVPRPDHGRGAAGQLEDALALALREEACPGLVASTGPVTCALIPAPALEEELFALGAAWPGARPWPTGSDSTWGWAGRWPAAMRAAPFTKRAAPWRRWGWAWSTPGPTGQNRRRRTGGPKVATYKDLGSFQLLLSLQEDEALRLFCDSILEPIEASEGHYGGELMRSLEAFIEENGQWERAARRLYCHRHTLRYRIRRVEELTGRDLSSARDRIEFWLGLGAGGMKVGVPSEVKTDEYRVALTPAGVRELIDAGHQGVRRERVGRGLGDRR